MQVFPDFGCGFDRNLFRFCCFLVFFLYGFAVYNILQSPPGPDGAQMFRKTKMTCLGYQIREAGGDPKTLTPVHGPYHRTVDNLDRLYQEQEKLPNEWKHSYSDDTENEAQILNFILLDNQK